LTGVAKDHMTVHIRPSETSYVVTDLQIGTSYHAYLEAIFASSVDELGTKSLTSWILIASTKGIIAGSCVSTTKQSMCKQSAARIDLLVLC